MKNIFLSASVPDPNRNPKYYETADIIAIRDAVRALSTVALPKCKLIWGGHPAITPLIRYVAKDVMKVDIQKHVLLYQSEFFRKSFPSDNQFFEQVIVVPEQADRESSLKEMRNRMFEDNSFDTGIFIGGMEGVEEEFTMFREIHPRAQILPVASTGAAALLIYNRIQPKLTESLLRDYAYMGLFRSLLKDLLGK